MWQSEGTTQTDKKNTATVGNAARFWQMAGAGQLVKRDSSRQKPPSLSQWLEFIGELEPGRPIEITSTMACVRREKIKDARAQVPVSQTDER
jgi:hypothetical protein